MKTRGYIQNTIRVLVILLLLVSPIYSQVDSRFIVGTFKVEKVIDGDTFRFKGLDRSTRLLCIDTEETFKGKDAFQKTESIRYIWKNYYYDQRQNEGGKMPIKLDSPFGYDTWQWAKEFFSDVDSVRLEKDDSLRFIDTYNRYLVYLIAYKKGKEINYNLECVRLGYSPYFNKYGNSKRFHNQFVEAQQYAQTHQLGIWNKNTLCYPDYEERIVWWNKRAKQLENFEALQASNYNYYFNLLNDNEYERLSTQVGKEVVVFGTISDVFTNKFPNLIRMPHTKTQHLDILVYEEYKNVFEKLDIETLKEYYIYIKGILKSNSGRLYIELKSNEQIWME
ncbi:MAG: thermonuclease family protein [Ignavibacteria bacterium]